MKKRVHLLIGGRVQGVCFRMYTEDQARTCNVNGWVRNLPDGRVEVLAEGEETDLQTFTDWCRHGPPYAHVSAFEVAFSEPTHEFREFRVAY